jgi:hypothetical protein
VFDTFKLGPSVHSGPSRINVHEHRAPTDASVQLLADMEKKTLDKVLASVRLTDCPVDCVIHHLKSLVTQRTHFIILYKLNGKEYRLDHHSDPFVERTMEQKIVAIKTMLALDISIHLLGPAFDNLARDPHAQHLFKNEF